MATSRQFKTISRCYGAERSSTSLSDHLGVHYTGEDWDAAISNEDLTPTPATGTTSSGLFYLTNTIIFGTYQPAFKGRKNYELTNHTSTTLSDHLGNVMAVVSDKLTKYSVVEAGVIPYSLPNMVSATDYDPFGMALEQREWQLSGVEAYSFSFNGKIEDDEILDRGRWQDYGFRAYRPDLGRFVSVDPLFRDYPELTTYQFASNTPIMAIDLDGLEGVGYQFLQTRQTNTGIVTERVVVINLYVAVGNSPKGYTSKDISRIRNELTTSYPSNFVDKSGNSVVFRFKVQELKVGKGEDMRKLARKYAREEHIFTVFMC
jgi:RHS repeat-associated protein